MSENKMMDHIQWIQWIEDDQWSIHWLRSVSKIILSFYDWNIFRFGVWRANSWFMIKPRRFLQNFCLFNKWYVPYLPLISTPIKKDTDLIWGITQIKPGKKPNHIYFIFFSNYVTFNFCNWGMKWLSQLSPNLRFKVVKLLAKAKLKSWLYNHTDHFWNP